VSEQLRIGPGTALRVLERNDDALEVEATYEPGGAPPPAHFHPAQDERFEVRAGEIQTRIDGQDGSIRAGDVLEIPRGRVHQMWNAGDEPAVVVWRTAPAGRTLEWFRELAALQRGEGREDPAGVLDEYADVFRLASG